MPDTPTDPRTAAINWSLRRRACARFGHKPGRRCARCGSLESLRGRGRESLWTDFLAEAFDAAMADARAAEAFYRVLGGPDIE